MEDGGGGAAGVGRQVDGVDAERERLRRRRRAVLGDIGEGVQHGGVRVENWTLAGGILTLCFPYNQAWFTGKIV